LLHGIAVEILARAKFRVQLAAGVRAQVLGGFLVAWDVAVVLPVCGDLLVLALDVFWVVSNPSTVMRWK
jgi:hypothetical protein